MRPEISQSLTNKLISPPPPDSAQKSHMFIKEVPFTVQTGSTLAVTRPTLAPFQSLLPFRDHGVLFRQLIGETCTGDRCPEESEAIDHDLGVTTVSKLTIIKVAVTLT